MIRRFWWAAIPPALLLLWWALDQRDAEVTVHVTAVARRRIESSVPTNGKVEPAEYANGRAEVEGVVQEVLVSRGQRVRAGDPLIRLDSTSARSSVATALTRRQEAQAELTNIAQGGKSTQLATVNSSLASARTAREVAARNYDVEQRLFAQGATTKIAVQEAKDTLDRATQQITSFEAQRQSLIGSSDRAVADAKLREANGALAVAQRNVSLSTVRAPTDGTLYSFDLKKGAYLSAGDLIGSVGNLDRVKINVYVDEPDLGRVAVGLPVVITWDGRPGKKWEGHVEKLPTEVVTLQTRNVGEVTTLVDNPDHDLLPGVTVNATVISKVLDSALVIPKAALRNNGSIEGVYVLRQNTLAWSAVQPGISDINSVQVVSGIREGDNVVDRVVDPNDAELRDKMRVRAIH